MTEAVQWVTDTQFLAALANRAQVLFLVVVIGGGICAGLLDFARRRITRRRRLAARAAPTVAAATPNDSELVSYIVSQAMQARVVRWGALVVLPKDRGPTLRSWRIEMEGIQPLRVVGRGDLEATVKSHVRAMRRVGRGGDRADVHIQTAQP